MIRLLLTAFQDGRDMLRRGAKQRVREPVVLTPFARQELGLCGAHHCTAKTMGGRSANPAAIGSQTTL